MASSDRNKKKRWTLASIWKHIYVCNLKFMVSKRSTPKPCFQFGIHSAQSGQILHVRCLKIFLRDTWKQMYYDTHICREDFGKDALMEDWVKKFEKLAGSQQHILHHKVHKPNMLKSYFGIERYTRKIKSCKRVNIGICVWYTCHNKWYISLIHIYQEVELGQLK
ncbi:hypothetical protein ACSBR2_035007 [Camellia fascicularis]